MKKCNCILCNKKEEKSIEHIIPKSIGNNSFTTQKICKNCNNQMGKKIDGPFANTPIVSSKREKLNLAGYKGTIPQTIKKGTDLDGNLIHFDKHFKPSFVPRIVKDEDNTITIIANNKKEFLKIGLKKLNRNRVPNKVIEKFISDVENMTIKKVRPKINIKMILNISDLEVEFIKIAFEYMHEVYGLAYANDDIGLKLKNILKKIMKDEKTDYHQFINSQNQNYDSIKETLGFDAHLIIPTLLNSNQMVLSILLFNGEINYTVIVSNDGKKYSKIKNIPYIIKITN